MWKSRWNSTQSRFLFLFFCLASSPFLKLFPTLVLFPTFLPSPLKHLINVYLYLPDGTFWNVQSCHLSWTRGIQFTPSRSILILSFHVCLFLSCGLFPTRSLTKFLISPIRAVYHIPCPSPSSYNHANIGWLPVQTAKFPLSKLFPSSRSFPTLSCTYCPQRAFLKSSYEERPSCTPQKKSQLITITT